MITLEDGTIGVLPIHFDVPEHYIPLDTFIETARETEAIIAALNERAFGGSLNYRVVVVPPKEGTFLAYLGITVVTVVPAAWVFLNSEPGEAFLRELTGHNLKELMGLAGRKVRERVLKKPPIQEGTEVTPDNGSLNPGATKALDETEREALAASMVMTETTRTFLMTDVEKLRRSGLGPETFPEGFQARNTFYRACVAEKEIRAMGFDETEEFPVKREDFTKFYVRVEAPHDAKAAKMTSVETTTLTVSSPNWDRKDKKRQWRGREPNGGLRNFQVADEGFWAMVDDSQLNLLGQDAMTVQWAYDQSGKRQGNFRVLKVLEYNGDVLAAPLDKNALNTIVGPHSGESGDQQDLFGRPDS